MLQATPDQSPRRRRPLTRPHGFTVSNTRESDYRVGRCRPALQAQVLQGRFLCDNQIESIGTRHGRFRPSLLVVFVLCPFYSGASRSHTLGSAACFHASSHPGLSLGPAPPPPPHGGGHLFLSSESSNASRRCLHCLLSPHSGVSQMPTLSLPPSLPLSLSLSLSRSLALCLCLCHSLTLSLPLSVSLPLCLRFSCFSGK